MDMDMDLGKSRIDGKWIFNSSKDRLGFDRPIPFCFAGSKTWFLERHFQTFHVLASATVTRGPQVISQQTLMLGTNTLQKPHRWPRDWTTDAGSSLQLYMSTHVEGSKNGENLYPTILLHSGRKSLESHHQGRLPRWASLPTLAHTGKGFPQSTWGSWWNRLWWNPFPPCSEIPKKKLCEYWTNSFWDMDGV